MAHNRLSWSEAAIIGGFLGLMASWRPFRYIVLIVLGYFMLMFVWDKAVTQSTLPEDQWSFSMDGPVLDTMDGQWPPEATPHFRYTWHFQNDSEYLVQSFTVNAELYRCDTIGQPISSCDYITRFNQPKIVNLPGGHSTSQEDLMIFTRSTRVPGIFRVKIWASDAIADSDREY